MIIEWLKFQVAPDSRAKFIREDAEIWTDALKNYLGFMGKEVWINPYKPNEIILVIRWQTRQQWKAISRDELEAIDARFAQTMGDIAYEMIESLEYECQLATLAVDIILTPD
jgi:uncharacterized protein (TIGR03792 family)